MVDKEEQGTQLTAEEAAIYDRQIRLWGVEAQQRYLHINYILSAMVVTYLVPDVPVHLE